MGGLDGTLRLSRDLKLPAVATSDRQKPLIGEALKFSIARGGQCTHSRTARFAVSNVRVLCKQKVQS
jgi:hypothetical protein